MKIMPLSTYTVSFQTPLKLKLAYLPLIPSQFFKTGTFYSSSAEVFSLVFNLCLVFQSRVQDAQSDMQV